MACLVFKAEDVRRVVEHSLAAKEQREVTVGYGSPPDRTPVRKPVEAPAVALVRDRGVYLMSNGTPRDLLDPNAKDEIGEKSYVAFAKGCHPRYDEDWWETARNLVGGDDFVEVLPWAEDIKRLLDAGAKTIVINFGKRRISLGRS